ncbi:Glycolipid transfer protein, partial [Lemmus lemmus]
QENICALFQKIKAVYDTDPAKFRTLQNILEVEKGMYGAEWPKVGATLALLWLKRGLRFIQVFLQSICDGERDENHPNLIRVNANKAYEMALKKYHGWLVQKIFKAALYAAPYKSDFLKALSKGQNVTEEECLEKIRLFLVNYTATIDAIYDMYTKMNAELDYTVSGGAQPEVDIHLTQQRNLVHLAQGCRGWWSAMESDWKFSRVPTVVSV